MAALVATSAGTVEGVEQSGVRVFRGVPYARPPVGPLRFRAPQLPEPWAGVRRANEFGRAAPQVGPANRLVRSFIGVADVGQSQDCLYLNVWTPGTDGGKRPVMVWIHGGAFIMGSGSTMLYDGGRLARNGDLVVVTFNYRLGALGFLNWRGLAPGPEDELPEANLGTRDQIAALEWVRDNIARFGGDPENVTVFGESAGAMSVGTLLGTPRAKGLFRRAILQSGAAHNFGTPDQAATAARHFFDLLGIDKPDRGTLEALPVKDIMRAQLRTTTDLGLLEGILPWQPSIDGDLLPESPLEAIEKGCSRDVSTLVGTNRDEWKLFMVSDPRARSLDERRLWGRFESILKRTGEDGAEYATRAHKAYHHVEGPRGGLPVERWVAFQSDRIFHYPAVRVADLQSAHATTYAYRFEWAPPFLGARVGACHGLELPFVFGTFGHPLMRSLWGTSRGVPRLSDRIQNAWIRFARTGRPHHGELPEWPEYTVERRSTMALSRESSLRDEPHERCHRFWDPIIREKKLAWVSS